MVNFSRMVIAIVTWNRPAKLQALARTLSATAPDYRGMYVIVNHPDGAVGFDPPFRCRVVNSGRPPEHPGCMAKSWNLAMLWAFRDPEVEWLLCAMDDLEVSPGWADCLGRYDASLYLAPAGDVGFLFNRDTLRKVGWFDERFPTIGFQEWDWQVRAIKGLGTAQVSIEDAHGWRHNPVGLSGHWAHYGTAENRQRNPLWEPIAAGWLTQKWGRGIGDVIAMLASGDIADPLIAEIDWYPWFQR